MINKIDGKFLHKILCGGCENLLNNKQYINALNVFPVPDGDTGENMAGTLVGGIKLKEISLNAGETMSEFSRNCLFNARGNSGVILSQFIRGIAVGLKGVEEVGIVDFIFALSSGVKYAYKAVLRPVEGTMLTVIREGITQVEEKQEIYEDFSTLLKDLISYMKKSLDNTPNILPVLKEAGVVDSGGAGIVIFFEGVKAVLDGKDVNTLKIEENSFSSVKFLDSDNMDYGYCTEFILQLTDKNNCFNLQDLTNYLQTIGDSVVAVVDEKIVKVHVHTLQPYKAMEFAHNYGEFLSVKVENMNLQHSEQSIKEPEKIKKDIAIVAVASGTGIKKYFSEIGADVIVDGGQSFNPSSQDFISAFEKLEAKHIIVLPNNKNVIMSAEQAGTLYENADVRIIKTKTIAEGYSCLSMIDTTETDIDTYISNMTSNLQNVTTAIVALAVRDAHVNNIDVVKGKFIGYCNDNIISCEEDKVLTTIKTLQNLDNIDEKETFVIFYGQDVSEEEKERLEEALYDEYPLADIAFIRGDQQIFSFILCLE